MESALETALSALAQREDLSADLTARAFGVVMRGEATAEQIKELLLGLKAKGETADEIAGAARALREAMVAIRPNPGRPVVDTCGTGGGTVGTFNISTAAAFVVAGAGARVAKHGNRSYTSKCGSADVLEALGVNIGLAADRAPGLLDEVGVAFLFAPNHHPAMRHVGPVRKQLGVATVMNLLGPLANPAGVRRQVIGVAESARAPLVAEALMRLGVDHALVVHAEIGMDEISPTGITRVWEVRDGSVSTWALDPGQHGLDWHSSEDLAGGEPKENAERIERILSGVGDQAATRAVVLNAGAGLYVAGVARSFGEAVELASRALSEGRGMEVLERLKVVGR